MVPLNHQLFVWRMIWWNTDVIVMPLIPLSSVGGGGGDNGGSSLSNTSTI